MTDPTPPVLPADPQGPAHRARDWWVFLGVLMAPAFVMLFVAKSETAQSFVVTVGSGITSLFCGFWLARRFLAEHGLVGRTLLGLVLAVVVYMASVVLCCIGCTVGGGEFRIE